MRFVYPTTIVNPDLIVIDPRIPLITSTLIAGYDCLSNKDFSGRGNDFSFAGAFTSIGATLANNSSSIIQTPVIEQDVMTVIACWNIASDGVATSIVNNLDTSTANYKGGRVIKLASNTGQLDLATGNAGNLNSMATGVSGGWTARAWSWNSTTAREIFHSGSVGNTITMSSRAKNTSRGYSVNGVPAGVSGGSITAGSTGTLGFLLFYNEYISPTDAASRMNIIASIMAGRGVAVP